MNRLANKEFDFRLNEEDKDEFGSLASSFNEMAGMLASYQARLKKNKDYLEGILESTADIIITVDTKGKIQTLNRGAEKALGYNREEIIGEPIEVLFVDPREREIAIQQLEYAESVKNYETRFKTKDGKVRNVLLTISRLKDSSGNLISTIGISKDITEEKKLQKQLIQSQSYAAIGQVFTGLQHTMKNMLNACKGGSYMVKLGLSKDDKPMFTEGWGIVNEGICSLTDMCVDMLKFVKEWKPKLEITDITKILAEVERLIKQTAKDLGINFILTEQKEILPVLIDVSMIQSSIMDIVSNALDACTFKDYSNEEKPEVRLGAYLNHKGEMLIIEVKDNGCGMSEEVKANIFNPFFSTKSKAGTGLGLAITSRMIEAHRGEFQVESEPDHGTTFRIMLPIEKTNKIKENSSG
jgi:two-component system sensor histidine kinase AtoS